VYGKATAVTRHPALSAPPLLVAYARRAPPALMRRASLVLGVSLGALGVGEPAQAHALGARYDLPLPLWTFTTGAAFAVAASFVVFAVGTRSAAALRWRWPLGAGSTAWFRVAARALQFLSLVLLVLVVVSGLFGTDRVTENFAPVFVWVIWWVGLAFIQALVGDLWSLVNPWAMLFAVSRRLVPVASPPLHYPERLGAWPAVLIFMIFAWLELVSHSGEQPRVLALLVLAYTAYTLAGLHLFGPRAWLRNVEAFTVAFDLLARFAPLGRNAEGAWELRPWGIGLTGLAISRSTMAFVLCLLATVSFDGFLETPAWLAMLEAVAAYGPLQAPLLALQRAGVDLSSLLTTLALLAAPMLFYAVYASCASLVGRIAGGGPVAAAFVLSLMPIAIAYHLAHYLSYLLLAGQLIVPTASDPLGIGWDLFGTADYSVDVTVVNARFVWYFALAAIVTGHIFSVFIAHLTALELFDGRRRALASQAPLVVLMLGYTMTSLWILAQPIVEP